MKRNCFFFFILFLFSFNIQAQNRNATVKVLNHYIKYSNANITALTALINGLERYNSLFNDNLKTHTKLGGEEYSAPGPNPFLDTDVFTMNEDNPDYLYSLAIKESVALPVPLRTELNSSIKSIKNCSQRLISLRDSMSNLFSGKMIAVNKDSTVLPYRLLFEAKRQLTQSKKYKDELFFKISSYYTKSCALTYSATDYIRSVEYMKNGMDICQHMMTDLSKNDSSHISQYVHQLDSLLLFLDRSELSLLKGITPFGDSKHFPNKNYVNGFDLYGKYEQIMLWFGTFSTYGKRFLNKPYESSRVGKCYYYHTECSSHFNTQGLLNYYNEYVILIGGGKMKIVMDDVSRSRYIEKGWGDEKHSLPQRTLLLWVKETPRFEPVWID